MLSLRDGYVCVFLTAAFFSGAVDTFAQCTPSARNVLLIAVDGGGRRDTVFFGHDPAATRGIDTILCEREIPPAPPGGIYDLRFSNPPGYEGVQPPAGLGQGTVRDYRAHTGPLQIDTLRVRFQPGAGGFPITFSWLPAAITTICDSAWLIDEVGGTQFKARMHAVPSLVMNNPVVTSLLVVKFGAVEVPPAPILVSPADGAMGQNASLTLVWNSLPGASQYTVQLSTDSLFGSTLVNDSTLATTSRLVAGLLPATSYFWRVAGRNGTGEGPWSTTRRFTTAGAETNLYAVQNGWNLISLPLSVSNGHTTVVYPTATSPAFAFGSTGYLQSDTLRPGKGYWLKFASAQDVGVTGYVRMLDTLDLNAGWNLIGTISTPVDTGSIQQIPAGLIVPSYFGFTGAYLPVDTLQPGRSYWVKASMSGQLVISSGVLSPGERSLPPARLRRRNP